MGNWNVLEMQKYIYLFALLVILAGTTYRYSMPLQEYDTAMIYLEDTDGMVLASSSSGIAVGNKVLFDIEIPDGLDGDYLFRLQVIKDGQLTEKKDIIEIQESYNAWERFIMWLKRVFQ